MRQASCVRWQAPIWPIDNDFTIWLAKHGASYDWLPGWLSRIGGPLTMMVAMQGIALHSVVNGLTLRDFDLWRGQLAKFDWAVRRDRFDAAHRHYQLAKAFQARFEQAPPIVDRIGNLAGSFLFSAYVFAACSANSAVHDAIYGQPAQSAHSQAVGGLTPSAATVHLWELAAIGVCWIVAGWLLAALMHWLALPGRHARRIVEGMDALEVASVA